MSKRFLGRIGLPVFLFFLACPVLFAQTPPPKQEEIKLQGIVFEGETSVDAVAVINGESFKAGATIRHFKIIRIERDFVIIDDLNTQEQFQYGILGDKQLLRAKPPEAPKSQKGPFDFLLDFFGWNKKK